MAKQGGGSKAGDFECVVIFFSFHPFPPPLFPRNLYPPPNHNPNSVQLKLLLIGDGSVGKTSLLGRYTDDTFSEQWISTIGIGFKTKTLELDSMRVKCQIWDTAGQERFRTITTSFFRGAHGIALCFDTTSTSSFVSISKWMQQVMESADQGVRLILVGTKTDKPDATVTRAQAEDLAAKFSTPERPIPVYFTSAKKNEGVKEAFEGLATLALQHHLEKQSSRPKASGAIKLDAPAAGGGSCAC